jgi:3-phenylpropionate/trans-cinnamate dioxygenase ferredoxin reductase subunit
MMTKRQTFVIVGAGLAGAKAAEALRTEGFDGRIILVGEESSRPYDRPALSKEFLQGKLVEEKLDVHPREWYRENDVDLYVDTRIAAVDRDTHEIVTEAGQRYGYDKLLLTTGSSPRRLTVNGGTAVGPLYLRTLNDSEALKAAFASGGRVAIIGGGWIGLETAAAARAAGCDVTVIEMAELPLVKVLGREVAEKFAALHRAHGVTLELNVGVSAIESRDAQSYEIRLTDERTVNADAIVAGVGIVPNIRLAEEAGLIIDNGVLVDEFLATSAPDIFAAGDVANAFYPMFGTHLRLEHWSAALNQGPIAAANMLGRNVAYDRVPYFFSDQYDQGMEYTGFVDKGHYDRVVFRGDSSKSEYIAFWMKDGRVLAGMNVNVWDVTNVIANLVRSRGTIDEDKLADVTIPLEDLVSDVGAATP